MLWLQQGAVILPWLWKTFYLLFLGFRTCIIFRCVIGWGTYSHSPPSSRTMPKWIHIFRIICSRDGTMVEIYLGACTKLGGMQTCNACQSECFFFCFPRRTLLWLLENTWLLAATHMTFVNLSIAILLISFYYRLRAVSDSSVHIQSSLRVWLLCSITYIPVAGVWVRFRTRIRERFLIVLVLHFCARYTGPHSSGIWLGRERIRHRVFVKWQPVLSLTAVSLGYTLADTSPLVSVIIIVVFSPSVMITVFFVRRRLLMSIARTVTKHDNV